MILPVSLCGQRSCAAGVFAVFKRDVTAFRFYLHIGFLSPQAGEGGVMGLAAWLGISEAPRAEPQTA